MPSRQLITSFALMPVQNPTICCWALVLVYARMLTAHRGRERLIHCDSGVTGAAPSYGRAPPEGTCPRRLQDACSRRAC